jgi:hypothetical protein
MSEMRIRLVLTVGGRMAGANIPACFNFSPIINVEVYGWKSQASEQE